MAKTRPIKASFFYLPFNDFNKGTFAAAVKGRKINARPNEGIEVKILVIQNKLKHLERHINGKSLSKG